MAGHVVLLLVVLLQCAEHLRRALELLGRIILVADHQDVVIDEGAVQRGVGGVVDRLAQVHAADFGAGMLGQGRDRAGHFTSPFAGMLAATL